MDDLISRQSVIDLLKKSTSRDIEEVVITDKHIKIIKDMPCAYDVEKVVEDLQKFSTIIEQNENSIKYAIEENMAVHIVKRGGVE